MESSPPICRSPRTLIGHVATRSLITCRRPFTCVPKRHPQLARQQGPTQLPFAHPHVSLSSAAAVLTIQQGGLLASWVDPIFFYSIVISADPRTNGPAPLLSALARAVPRRAAAATTTAAAAAAAADLRRPPAVAAEASVVARAASYNGRLEETGFRPFRQEVDITIAGVVFEKSKAQVGSVTSNKEAPRCNFFFVQCTAKEA